MNLEELRATLIEWLNELKTWYLPDHKWDDYIFTDAEYAEYKWPMGRLPKKPKNWENDPNQLHLLLFTNDHEYSITVTTDGYFGCIAHTRKPRAGESWTRGNDLPDGKFSKEMFDIIIKKCLAYELIARVKPQKAIADGGTSPVPPPNKE